jgi:hypothetical protein
MSGLCVVRATGISVVEQLTVVGWQESNTDAAHDFWCDALVTAERQANLSSCP